MQSRTKKAKKSYSSYVYSRKKGGVKVRRDIAVVNGVPLYCSTGRNSNLAGTWLPFLGMNGEVNKRHSRTWFLKPHGGRIPHGHDKYFYPPEVINIICEHLNSICPDYTDANIRTMLGRFGCLKSMAASASIGGGFWGTDHGVELIAYLRKNYQELMLDHQVEFIELGSYELHVVKNDSAEIRSRKRDRSVAAVNGFLFSQSPSSLFFDYEKDQRYTVYQDFGKQEELQYRP